MGRNKCIRLTLLYIGVFFIVGVVQASELNGRVVRVVDGDTVVVLDALNTQHKIRLQGIDTPEEGSLSERKQKLIYQIPSQGKMLM